MRVRVRVRVRVKKGTGEFVIHGLILILDMEEWRMMGAYYNPGEF